MTSFLRSPRARVWGVALLLFAFALALRVAGLTWGLPHPTRWYSLHPDERDVFAAAWSLDFFGGDFNPNFYNYPSLFIYLMYIAHGAGTTLGLFAATPSGAWQLLHDFMLSGRIVSALLGAATAPVIFFLTRAVLPGRRGAPLLAGGAAALTPGLVQHSHFATVDVAATFFVALCLLFTARALNGAPAQRALVLSALFAGLAAATKYNAGLALVAPLCAAWQLRREGGFSWTLWLKTPLAAAAAFLFGCPGAVLYFRDFWGNSQNGTGFSYELFVHPRLGSGEIFQNTGNGWWYHGTFNLPFVFTAPALLLALAGLALLVRQKNLRCLPLLVFSALFFLSLGLSQVRFMRYVFPLVPALCMGIGALTLLPRRAAGLAAATSVAALAVGCADVLRPLLTPDARDRTAAYFAEKAATESSPPSIGLFENPWFWTPPFSPLAAPPPARPQDLAAALEANPRVRLTVVPDAASLQVAKPDYVTLSEFEWRDKERLGDPRWLAWDKELRAHYAEWYVAVPPQTLLPYPYSGRAFVPHDYLYTHPRVRLWKRRA